MSYTCVLLLLTASDFLRIVVRPVYQMFSVIYSEGIILCSDKACVCLECQTMAVPTTIVLSPNINVKICRKTALFFDMRED